MSRPLRLQGPDLLYHVMARGNAKMRIFLDDIDHARFLDVLARSAERHALVVVAYCLMPNHYHLILRTPNANLSSAMQHLNGQYARWWNRRHALVGHVFQGRFKAQVVQQRRYLVAVCRYVLRNPVRAGLVGHPAEWRWSSYTATAGRSGAPSWLDPRLVLAEFGRAPESAAAFARFVAEGAEDPGMKRSVRQDHRVIGDPEYVESFAREARGASPAVPLRERLQARPPLERLLRGDPRRSLLAARIQAARRAHGYTVIDIARHLGVGTASVWRLLRSPPPAGQRGAPALAHRETP